ncbi:UNVERIFIED_CONTAM: Sugar transporter ERD6-like 4 [Sesamum latifolium]|uniref:Sugar transporter ERD6-like 4 n=1 Tax=Sesamum latifolium TaxID=2727402 RepID=A0AAW2X7W5_9LAMI
MSTDAGDDGVRKPLLHTGSWYRMSGLGSRQSSIMGSSVQILRESISVYLCVFIVSLGPIQFGFTCGYSNPTQSEIINDLGLTISESLMIAAIPNIIGWLAISFAKVSITIGVMLAYLLGLFLPWRILAVLEICGFIKQTNCYPVFRAQEKTILVSFDGVLLANDCQQPRCFNGILFKDPESTDSILGVLALVGLLFLVLGFSIGLGGVPWIIMSEILPVSIKSLAGSVATLANWLSASVVTMTANLLFTWSCGGTFLIYAIVSALTIVFVAFCVPETKGKTLEEIQLSFR